MIFFKACGLVFLSNFISFSYLEKLLKMNYKSQKVKREPLDIVKNVQNLINLFPIKVKCLGEAIFIFTYLKYYNFSPILVIGFSLNPMTSHAWVELNNKILNNSNINIYRFKEICYIK